MEGSYCHSKVHLEWNKCETIEWGVQESQNICESENNRNNKTIRNIWVQKGNPNGEVRASFEVGTPGIRHSMNSICIAEFQCSYSLQLLLGNHNIFLLCTSMYLPSNSL